MANLDKYYPGMEAVILQNGLLIQAQESHQLMAASDQRGEQTINRDAKTLIKILASVFYIYFCFLSCMWEWEKYARTWKNMLWILRKSSIFGLIYLFIRWQIEHPIFLNTHFCWILGGIKGYWSDKMNVLKWCLNRPKQAKVM